MRRERGPVDAERQRQCCTDLNLVVLGVEKVDHGLAAACNGKVGDAEAVVTEVEPTGGRNTPKVIETLRLLNTPMKLTLTWGS